MSAGRLPEDEVVLAPSSSGEQTPGERPVERAPLLDEAVAQDFTRRWSDVQVRFVDDPQGAVREADALVHDLLQALAARFRLHPGGLQDGREPGTEDLRLALQSYRSFFQRLLDT
jgi:hypothetical protein